MCKAENKTCKCGAKTAVLHFGNNVLPENIVTELYCPTCSAGVDFNGRTMIEDNGWIIDFEVDGARLFAHEFPAEPESVTPDFIFDNGFCTWVGYTPTDHYDSLKEKEQIIELAKTDRKRYFEEMKNWSNDRVRNLADAGWRKAKQAS